MSDSDLKAVEGVSLRPFRPSPAQALAKARLHHRLAARQGLTDLESLDATQVVDLAGDRRVRGWLRDPEFAAWLYDRDDWQPRAVALRDVAIDVLEDILLGDYDPKVLSAKDKLKAADMLLNLTSSYPKTVARKGESVEPELTDAEVQQQLEALQRKLLK